MSALTIPSGVHVPSEIPKAGLIINSLLSLCTIAVLAICFTRRIQSTRGLDSIPVTRWILFAIYADSIIFIIATAVLWNGFGLNMNEEICSSSILMCITCYLTTKLIYYFLVEKVYIIRKKKTPRLKSKLYCFNVFGMLLPYCVIVGLNYAFKVSYFDEKGMCIVGMQKKSVLPLIIIDAVVNFYLTMLFVIPIRSLYTYKNSPNSALRTLAIRSFFGALGTLTSSVTNLTVLMVLEGEPSWVCLMCCNADILFSVLVLHWVTSKDTSSTNSTANSTSAKRNTNPTSKPHHSIANKLGLPFSSSQKPSVTTHISAARDLDEEDDKDVYQGMNWGRKGTVRKNSMECEGYPMDKIRVQVGHVVEIRSDTGTSNGEGFSRPRSNQSTDDLVKERNVV